MTETEDCPLVMIRLCFKLLGLKFGEESVSKKYLNCRMPKKHGSHRPQLEFSLSGTSATQHMRSLISLCNISNRHYTEKSFKVGGVTDFLKKGNSLELAMVRGRWKSVVTPMYYRNDDPDFRLFLAKLSIPVSD